MKMMMIGDDMTAWRREVAGDGVWPAVKVGIVLMMLRRRGEIRGRRNEGMKCYIKGRTLIGFGLLGLMGAK